MNSKQFYIFTLLAIFLASFKLYATHNRAGEITYEQIGNPGDYKFKVKLTTYTEVNSTANRSEVDIFFGDGKSETVSIDMYPGDADGHILVKDGIYRNTYTTTHIYPGPGTYKLEFYDPNRVRDIINMSNSVMTPFYVHTQLQINPSRGNNRSPVLLQPPIDFARRGAIFEHNPNAYDPDGDSLSFTLIPPQQNSGLNVYNYYIPYGVNGFTLDAYTGELVWDYPDTVGIYNIAILVEEFRDGVRIGYIVRDMQIRVLESNNNPPQIEPISDTCVEAGKPISLQIPVYASDPDVNQIITLTANGGPFIQDDDPAYINPQKPQGKANISTTFYWTPSCSAIRKEPYSVVFKVQDSIKNDSRHISLTDLEHFFITVVGPAPENLTINNTIQGIELDWDPPSACSNARGYYIYRKVDSSYWDTSLCETGVPAYSGFKFLDSTFGYNATSYKDNNNGLGLTPGLTYCYRVTAYYVGENYKVVEGYASHEVCARQLKDVPVITHASVEETDVSSGKIYVDWSKPTDIDTQLYHGPYKYELYRSSGNSMGQKTLLAQFQSNTFAGLNDTIWTDSNLDTKTKQYAYQVDFYGTDSGQYYFLGNAQSASSIFLTITPSHKSLILRWNEIVPWYNEYYVIYKYKPGLGIFDSIGWSKKSQFIDTGLVNGIEYCYKIMSFGYFSSTEFVYPIINYSQEVCKTPVDTVPPNPPILSAEANCDLDNNYLSWWYLDSAKANDVVGYKIYYSQLLNEQYFMIQRVDGKYVDDYTDARLDLEYSLAGCYMITAIDSYGNESAFSNRTCVDNCPHYELPNIFTPNGDGINDIYHPIGGAKHIEKIDMHIFNRWGQIVFYTTDPEINWDGKENEEQLDVSEGVYYYICDVYQIYLEGLKPVTFKGTITLIR